MWLAPRTRHGRDSSVPSPRRPSRPDQVCRRFGEHLSAARGLSAAHGACLPRRRRHALAFAGRRGVAWDEVDLAVLRSWLGSMVAARRSRSTLARRGAAVRSFFAWAGGGGAGRRDPAVRLVTAHPARAPTVLAVAPAARLVDVGPRGRCRPRPGRAARLGPARAPVRHRRAGGRARRARRRRRRPRSAVVRVLGKGAKERVVPSGLPAAGAVGWLARGRPGWPAPASGPRCSSGSRGGRVDQRQLRAPCTELPRLAGVDDLAPHALRHTAATHLLDGGSDLRRPGDPRACSLATTQRYTHVTADRLRASYQQAHPRA